MKLLYLIRHAKSSWADPSLSDFDRPLNKRGKRDAPFMGRRMAAAEDKPELIMTSPARRARKTARVIGAALGFAKKDIVLNDDLYTFDAEALVAAIRRAPDTVAVLAVVGHNYGLTDCAEWLSGERLDNIPTCGIVLLEFATDTWRAIGSGSATLKMFDYPKLHADRHGSI